jgi:hypothetical protein
MRVIKGKAKPASKTTFVQFKIEGRAELLCTPFRDVAHLHELLPCNSLVSHFAQCPQDEKPFFASVLPAMQRAALALPSSIPLLRAGEEACVTLSQSQAFGILANGFFGLLPGSLVTFDIILNQPKQHEKLVTLLHYFQRLSKLADADGTQLSIHRRVLKHFPAWKTSACATLLSPDVAIRTDGRIEDCDPETCLHADFANKIIGGGVLGHGCVQGK